MRWRVVVLVVATLAGCGAPPPDNPPQQTFHVAIEALGCYGMCPRYSLQIDGRGRARLNATRNLPMLGRSYATVNVAELRSILDRHDFFGMSCIRQADEDTMVIDVADGSRLKRVSCSASPLRDEPFARMVSDLHAFVAKQKWTRL